MKLEITAGGKKLTVSTIPKMRAPDEERPCNGGIQRKYQFPNGYGASVVRHSFSYGHESGLWELAVIHGGDLCYDTPITSDVEGHLNEEHVNVLLDRIEALPRR